MCSFSSFKVLPILTVMANFLILMTEALPTSSILPNENTSPPPHGTGVSNIPSIPSWIDDWIAPKEFVGLFPYYLAGHDNDGVPVYVFEIGNWKPQEALKAFPGDRESVTEIASKCIEQGVYWMLRDGLANNGQGVAIIADYDGLNLIKIADPAAIKLLLKLWSHMNRLYTVLNYALVINVNFAAESFIRMAEPFIGNMYDKCEFFGTQKSKWLHHILRKIPRSELPAWYGGEEDWRPLWVGGTGPPLNITQTAATVVS